MDTKRFARFSSPGHATTGDRYRSGAERRQRVGYEFAHSVIDDHSRLAYTELHDNEKADTVTGFVERALALYAGHGIKPRRLETDNAWAYTHNNSLRQLAEQHGIQLRRIPPRTPQTQRQSRALPTNPRPRMGLRPDLPQLKRPSPSLDALAQALKPAPQAQRHRQPPTNHPRSQPLKAQQLDADIQDGHLRRLGHISQAQWGSRCLDNGCMRWMDSSSCRCVAAHGAGKASPHG